MRRLALVALAAGCGAAGAAAAQTLSPEASAAALADAAFASGGAHGAVDFLNEETLDRAQGPAALRMGEFRFARPGRQSVDTVHVSTVQTLLSPSGLPLTPGQSGPAQAYAVTFERAWPGALGFQAGGVGVDFSPHAGIGMTSFGGVAEAGGRIELSQKRDQMAKERLKALGVGDGAKFGDQGRWYLFAAASGRAVGLNMLRGDGGGWSRAGWTTDPTSTLVGDAQVGVGWRKGAIQTSLGYVHQQLKNDHLLYGQDNRSDSMVAFTFSVRPTR